MSDNIDTTVTCAMYTTQDAIRTAKAWEQWRAEWLQLNGTGHTVVGNSVTAVYFDDLPVEEEKIADGWDTP